MKTLTSLAFLASLLVLNVASADPAYDGIACSYGNQSAVVFGLVSKDDRTTQISGATFLADGAYAGQLSGVTGTRDGDSFSVHFSDADGNQIQIDASRPNAGEFYMGNLVINVAKPEFNPALPKTEVPVENGPFAATCSISSRGD